MKRKRHTPEQVVRKLREAERMQASGVSVPEICRKLEVSVVTYQRWRKQYQGMATQDVTRLKHLEKQNTQAEGDQPGKILTPERRRRVVIHLQQHFGVSERRACTLAGQHRSTQRRKQRLIPGDEYLRARLHLQAEAHPRWGYRKQHHLLIQAGFKINRKRIRRLWREENLQVRRKTRRKRTGRRSPGGILAAYPGHVWAVDFEFDQTRKGPQLKIANMVDEFTHEGIAGEVAYSIDAQKLIHMLDGVVEERGAPTYLRCDNGPEFISHALARWCRKQRMRIEFIEPGSPWQNGFCESYNGRMREELLNLEIIENALEGQVLVDDWRAEFNTYRPHRSIKMQTPSEFAARWRAEHGTRRERPPLPAL